MAFTAMASPCEILLDGRDERALRRAGQAAIDEVRRIESKYSRYLPGSMVSRINAAAGQPQAVAVDEETASLLDFAGELWRLGEGRFDITSGVLRRAWDFKAARLPGADALAALLPLVGWGQVEWAGGRIRLPQAGMEIDFGGFGKEYAADRAAGVLQQHGVAHALVNLGGDIHVLGPRGLPQLAGQAWQVAVQHPRAGLAGAAAGGEAKAAGVAAADASAGGAVLASIPVLRGGLATSGDYERFFVHEGVRYCHILNPRTGWPVTHWQSVSVLAANTTAAGALSTLAMLQGDAAEPWLDGQGVAWLAVRADGQVLRRMPAA